MTQLAVKICMKNFISHNIKHLCEQEKLTQNEFGDLFGLGRSVIGMYVSEKSTPKIDTIQKICAEFNLSIDDFIKRPLDQIEKEPYKKDVQNGAGVSDKGATYQQQDSVAGMIAKEVTRQMAPTMEKVTQIHEILTIMDLQDSISNLKALALEKIKNNQKTINKK